MSFAYIIAAIILATILTSFVFVFIGRIEHKNRKLNINWFLLMIIIALTTILAMVLIYHSENDISENDLRVAYDEGYEQGHEEGWDDGYAETRQPTNEEMETWFASTKEVLVGTNEGGDMAVHIINSNGEEWVLFADDVIKK